MFSKPQHKHKWLDQLVGEWRIEQQCTMPDGTTNQTEGTMTCRSIGGLWIIAESSGTSDEGDWTCVLTLGYDTKANAYIGTFIGSMMTHLWPYKGNLDASGNRLPLDSTGPTFDGQGMAEYCDTIEIIGKDEWDFTGEMKQEDGTWLKIMSSKHFRSQRKIP